MVFFLLSFSDCENSGKKTKNRKVGKDVKDGEISDTASLEEINEYEFNKVDDDNGNNSDVKVNTNM